MHIGHSRPLMSVLCCFFGFLDSHVYVLEVLFHHYHHQVSCCVALAIISFHTSLSLVVLNTSITPVPSHFAIPSIIFSRRLPLLRFPSIVPVVIRCSSFSLLITWPRKVAWRFRILFMRDLFVCASLRTYSLDFFAFHVIFWASFSKTTSPLLPISFVFALILSKPPTHTLR